jgi:hypothetical protein
MKPKKEPRKFYRTVYTVEVLSEEPITVNVDLDDLNYMITDGDCSGKIETNGSDEIDGVTAAKLLMEQGSDPEFFRIDKNGNDISDDEEE